MKVCHKEMEMNGLISESAQRSKYSKSKLITSVAAGVCLMSGFVFGMNIKPEAIPGLRLFKTQTISFEKISWISAEKLINFELKEQTNANVEQEVAFIPFELKQSDFKKEIKHVQRKSSSNLSSLAKLIKKLSETETDLMADYQKAASSLRSEFVLATQVVPGSKITTIAMTQSSVDVLEPVSPKTVLPLKRQSIKKLKAHQVKRHSILIPSRNGHEDVAAQSEKMNTQQKSTQDEIKTVMSSSVVEASNTSVSVSEAVTTTSNDLSQAEKKKLSNDLLSAQLLSVQRSRAPQKNADQPAKVAKVEISSPEQNAPEEVDEDESASQLNSKAGSMNCDLNNHFFIKPAQVGSEDSANQIKPEQKEWISKSSHCEGWIKVSSPEFINTVTLHPAPNQGSTLLLDSNSLALIAMKSGVHVAKGMGTILGRLPDQYKIEFTGRAEETEYFESNGRKYFAILNAEPGAGVVELQSQSHQKLSSTVFTPVLEDTITYLDLSEPTAQNISVRVVKNGVKPDAEVSGLTVGISTQSGIQAITQSTGAAILRNVNVVHGFPVFIDVSSKQGSEQGYTYRYELKHRKKSGTFLVHQVSEKSIQRWIKQLNQSLSDQSAMIVGSFKRKGFQNYFHVHANPLTAKFGLEPMSFSILINGKISSSEPLEGDAPRFMSVQVPEGLTKVDLLDEKNQSVQSNLMPISPRVIHVITE